MDTRPALGSDRHHGRRDQRTVFDVLCRARRHGQHLAGRERSHRIPGTVPVSYTHLVLSPTVTAGKVLVVDSSQIELLVVEDLHVEIGTDADDFTKNVRTILGELRVVPTFRAVGAAVSYTHLDVYKRQV